MTFIEARANDNEHTLKRMIADAYTALYNESPPAVRFGRTIVWEGRTFQLMEFGANSEGVQNEERVFRCWMLERARMQVGSVQGFVFRSK